MPSLNFLGKTFVQNHHLAVPFRQLIPKLELSVSEKLSLHDNLIIQGDNLDALKALLPIYSGKVKCIYIDPPYNTGNESWIYNDNVKAPLINEWFKNLDINGKPRPVGKEGEDLTRHDKWLCMMMPRLKLLRELLREDGVIFVSIDDNEQAHLKLLMDEVFGEQNFISNIIWRKKKEISSDNKGFSSKIEYVIVYSKTENFEPNQLALNDTYIKSSFSNNNNDEKGLWRGVAITASKGHQGGGYDYTVITPSGKEIKRTWLYPESSFRKLVEDKRIFWGKTMDSIPQRIMYLSESKGQIPDNLWLDEGTNKDGKNEINEILEGDIFDTPKPVSLIKKILKLSTDENSIILDSCAGSGTTAQAVLEMNKEDGGNRQFILVEMEDYANNITAERVRRVIKGVPNSKKETLKEGLGGTFSYFQLGSAIEMESLLDGTNLPNWSDMARYLYFTATGENIIEVPIVSPSNDPVFIGSSSHFNVYLMYQDNLEWLKKTAFNSDHLKALPEPKSGKRNLVFAPAKYLDDKTLRDFNCTFQQLPYEIYKMER